MNFELHERENGLWAYTVTDEYGKVWDEAEGIESEAEAYDQAEQMVAFYEERNERKRALEGMH
jgi:hypothetical protein